MCNKTFLELSIKPKPRCFIFYCTGSFLCAGGYTVGPKPVIDLLRNRSRPYLFSNSLPPPVVACASKVFEMLTDGSPLVEEIQAKTKRFEYFYYLLDFGVNLMLRYWCRLALKTTMWCRYNTLGLQSSLTRCFSTCTPSVTAVSQAVYEPISIAS